MNRAASPGGTLRLSYFRAAGCQHAGIPVLTAASHSRPKDGVALLAYGSPMTQKPQCPHFSED
jgi:hypothetical protein